MKKFSIVLLAVIGSIVSCKKDNAPEPVTCDTSNVTYAAVVKPIIAAKCLACHTGAAGTGYDLSTYAGMVATVNQGKLLPAITHSGPKPMPLNAPKLDDCSISKITAWVNNGALNN